MTTNYTQLLLKTQEIHDLGSALSLLMWDRETNMPPGGSASRTQQIATLQQMAHRLATSDEMGNLLEASAVELEGADPDSLEARHVKVLRRNYERSRKVPNELVQRIALTSGPAREAWIQARQESNFALFQPWLEKVVALCQELAECYGYSDEKYDALLDGYEQGTKTAEVRATFETVKAATVPLLQAILERGRAIDDSFLHQPFDRAGQETFVRQAVAAVGYDFNRGHLGTVVHPFAISFSRDDVRITTRWHTDFLNPALFGGLHEAGHGAYEQNIDPAYDRTGLAGGASLGIHESQSRTFENLIGRSLGFWQAHYPGLQAIFPAQLGHVPLEDFYRAINKVQPSYIRVEADELTYNFHIMLRFELEQAMLNGDLQVADLPAAWNDKMQAYLGVTPPDDARGCLQDIHWTRPGFGYFPTYALGNLYAAQLTAAALAQDAGIGAELAAGRPAALVSWLRDNVHRHGRKYTPGELVLRATGKALDPTAFIAYATAKFSAIYEL